MSRFSEPQHPDFQAINASLHFDRRLWPYDVAQSRAHARMLAAIGVIDDADRDALLAGLDAVAGELEAGAFAFLPDDEDVHMAIERRVTEIAGRAGARCTRRARATTRSPPTSCSSCARRRAARLALAALVEVLIGRAQAHLDWQMPGYTHLQRAQPVYLSHHLLAYAWMLMRDRARFAFVLDACSVLPLGAGALAGVNFPTDRAPVAAESVSTASPPNSIDAVSNRDFALDYLAAPATAATHLSRLGAELVLWSSEEFGFCELADAWSLRVLDHAAEEEPRRGRAAARQGAARRRRIWWRCTA